MPPSEAKNLWLANPESPGAFSSEPDVVSDLDVGCWVEDVGPELRFGWLPDGIYLEDSEIVGAVRIASNDVGCQPTLAVGDGSGFSGVPLPSRVGDQFFDLHQLSSSGGW